jgi:hypothetical protein
LEIDLLLLLLDGLSQEDSVLLLLLLQLMLQLVSLQFAVVLYRIGRRGRQHSGGHVDQFLLAVHFTQSGKPRRLLLLLLDGHHLKMANGLPCHQREAKATNHQSYENRIAPKGV